MAGGRRTWISLLTKGHILWSRGIDRGSGTRDDPILVDHLARVFERGGDVFAGQFRMGLEDSVYRVASGQHPEDVPDHDSRAGDAGLAAADFGVDRDTTLHDVMITGLKGWGKGP